MWSRGFLIAVVLLTNLNLWAQNKKSYYIDDVSGCRMIKLHLNTTYGKCTIRRTSGDSYIEVNNTTEHGPMPQYSDETTDHTKEVSIRHINDGSNFLSSTISRQIFTGHMATDCIWNLHLSDARPLQLNLKYTVGDMDLDLSDLPIEKLAIHTGSANVKIKYEDGSDNLVEMDTFYIKTDMGTLVTENLNLSRSKKIIADIGFGKVLLDFAAPYTVSSDIQATVGAGKLVVVLPYTDSSVTININGSPLCHISLPDEFIANDKNEFVYNAQDGDQDIRLNFNVDVAIGSISFVFGNQ